MSTPRILGIPCWTFPILAAVAWLVTLLSMITSWIAKDSAHYPEMWPEQRLAYISNVGASKWGKPLFITGSFATATLFAIAFVTERWLRIKGQLIHHSNAWAVLLSITSAFVTFVGTCGMLLLTIFDVRRHPFIHYTNAAMFILCYISAAAFICAEKKHLSSWFPNNAVLRLSYRIKAYFIVGEALLVIIGTGLMYAGIYDPTVVMEWMLALFFAFYMSSFAIDFFAIPEKNEKGDIICLRAPSWDEEKAVTRPCVAYGWNKREYLDVL